MREKLKPKPYPADYKGATPRQVAEAVLRHKPGKPQPKPAKKASEPIGSIHDLREGGD